MFGYITPLKSELKVKEFEYFRSYYHGLCYSIKNNFGNIPRLTLNYDMTFIGFILEGLSNESIIIENKRCIKHPTYDIQVIKDTNALKYAANLSITFFDYKLKDNINDDDNNKSKVFNIFLGPYSKKAALNHYNINSIIKLNLANLSNMEKEKNFNSLDQICHPFSNIMASILKNYPHNLFEDSNTLRDKLYNLGYCIGKYIYLMDAFDDLEEDILSNQFNPLIVTHKLDRENYKDIINEIINEMDFLILSCISHCKEILDSITLLKHREILNNIITLGMTNEFYQICNKMYKKIPPNN